MVSRDEGKLVLYPIYFDCAVSRIKGRKVSKKHAVEKPTAENIAKAAQSLGLHPVLEKERYHPSTSWKQDGRVLIDHKTTKQKLLVQIANRL
jgi:signal recognition particle subunit SRP19